MGLGKTLQTIGLILAEPPKEKSNDEAQVGASNVMDGQPKLIVEGMKVVELKKVLQKVGLPYAGKKAVLIQRCLTALENGTLDRSLIVGNGTGTDVATWGAGWTVGIN